MQPPFHPTISQLCPPTIDRDRSSSPSCESQRRRSLSPITSQEQSTHHSPLNSSPLETSNDEAREDEAEKKGLVNDVEIIGTLQFFHILYLNM